MQAKKVWSLHPCFETSSEPDEKCDQCVVSSAYDAGALAVYMFRAPGVRAPAGFRLLECAPTVAGSGTLTYPSSVVGFDAGFCAGPGQGGVR